MIGALARVVSCLAIGEIVSRFLPLALPPPIIGLLVLFGWLLWLGHVPSMLGKVADRMLELFGLFFVPAGVGVVAYKDVIGADTLAIVLALTVGTLVTLACTALVASLAAKLMARADGPRANGSIIGGAPWQDQDKAIS